MKALLDALCQHFELFVQWSNINYADRRMGMFAAPGIRMVEAVRNFYGSLVYSNLRSCERHRKVTKTECLT